MGRSNLLVSSIFEITSEMVTIKQFKTGFKRLIGKWVDEAFQARDEKEKDFERELLVAAVEYLNMKLHHLDKVL